ncbi:MAG: hypothetical protein FWE15_30585 [Actinomycetia bacterium]|nr:hypothetical protein [Actinomycetes bacterium]
MTALGAAQLTSRLIALENRVKAFLAAYQASAYPWHALTVTPAVTSGVMRYRALPPAFNAVLLQGVNLNWSPAITLNQSIGAIPYTLAAEFGTAAGWYSSTGTPGIRVNISTAGTVWLQGTGMTISIASFSCLVPLD